MPVHFVTWCVIETDNRSLEPVGDEGSRLKRACSPTAEGRADPAATAGHAVLAAGAPIVRLPDHDARAIDASVQSIYGARRRQERPAA